MYSLSWGQWRGRFHAVGARQDKAYGRVGRGADGEGGWRGVLFLRRDRDRIIKELQRFL
jgi:hypothetical protein